MVFFSFFLVVINLKIVTKKLLGLTYLILSQFFNIHKLIKVVIVYKDKNVIFTTFEIILLDFEHFDNSQKLIITSFILSFT